MNVDLNELSFFVGIARQPSLGAAAKALGVPKSTLSRKLAQLEDRLAVRLIHRSQRQLRLTEAGVLLFERCGDALAQLEDATSSVRALKSEARGKLRLSAPVYFGDVVLAPALVGFRAAHPDISLDVFLSDHFVDLAAEGFDLAVRLGESSDGSLVTKRLGAVDAVLAASPQYLARHGTPETPESLRQHACIFYNTPPYQPLWRLRNASGAEVALEIRGPVAVNSLPFARAFVLGGLGIARLPFYMCRKDLADGTLVRVLPSWSAGNRPVYLVYPGRRHLAGKVKVLIEYLSALAKENALW